MKVKFLILIAILSLSYTAQAQINLGSIKNKIKNTKANKTETTKKSGKTSGNSVSGALNSDAVMLDNLILDEFNFLSTQASQISKLRAMNLPMSLNKTKNFRGTFKSADGRTLATYTAYAEAPVTKRSWLLGNWIGVDSASRDFKFTEEGDYYLEFSVSGQVFDRFDFSVAKFQGPIGAPRLIVNGPWKDLAYLHYDPTHRNPQISFSVYMRNMLYGTGPRPKNEGRYVAKIVRERDGKTVGLTTSKRSLSPRKWWTRNDFIFFDASRPARLSPQKLLSTDGKYRIEFTYEGKLYGKYTFNVLGGKFKGLSKYNGEKIGSDGTVTWMLRQK